VRAGGSEWGTTYTMPRDVLSLVNAEQDAYLAAVAAGNASGSPDYPVATVRPGTIPAYFGEGSSQRLPTARTTSRRSRSRQTAR
jgi:hypothetical protein